jgi:hypothetical protein
MRGRLKVKARALGTFSITLMAALLCLGVPAFAAAKAPLRIVSPAPDGLVKGHRLEVKVKVGPEVSHLRLSVGRRAGRVVQAAGPGGVRRGSVSVAGLPRGRAAITVSGRRHGTSISLSRSVVLGRRSPGLLRHLSLPRHAAGALRMRLRLGGAVSTFQLTVDGRKAKLLHAPAEAASLKAAVWLRRHGHPTGGRRADLVSSTTIPLSADDGLRPGRNRIVVLAYRAKTGRWARATRNVWMSRRTPLVAAGPDRSTFSGGTLRLDGGDSRPARPHERLRYRWRIVEQPQVPGSEPRARLLDPHAVRPRLVTHRPGDYRVALRLDGGAAVHRRPRTAARATASAVGATPAEDVVTLEATASIPAYGVHVNTDQPGENGSTRTTIEGEPINPDGTDDWIETPKGEISAIVLSRTTLEPEPVKTYPCDAGGAGFETTLRTLLESVGTEQIEILAGNECMAPGGSPGGSLGYASTFTSVVVNGRTVAYNAGNEIGAGGPGAVSGLLREVDVAGQEKFSFVYPEAVEFDTRFEGPEPKSSPVELGTLVAEPGSSTPKPDFYWTAGAAWPEQHETSGVAIRALSPAFQTISGLSENLNVQGIGVGSEVQQLELVRNLLAKIAAQDVGGVLMLQTYGEPRPNGATPSAAWEAIGRELEHFGGTPAVWDELRGTETGNYALVGTVYAGGETSALRETSTAEASGPMEGAEFSGEAKKWVGTLRGVLGRGENGLPVLRAVGSQSTGWDKEEEWVNPAGVIPLAEGTPESWPVTDKGEAYENALTWISERLGPEDLKTHEPRGLGSPLSSEADGQCYLPSHWDVRAAYCEIGESIVNEWGGHFTEQLQKLRCPRDVAGFEKPECEEVVAQLEKEFADIASVHSLTNLLKRPFGEKGKLPAEFTNIDATVEKESVHPPASTSGIEDISVNPKVLLDGVLTLLSSLPSNDPFGVIDGVLDMGFSLSDTKEDHPSDEPLIADKQQIGVEAAKRLEAAESGIGQLNRLLVTDWSKLRTTAADANSIWGSSEQAIENTEKKGEAGAIAWYYEKVMPAAYSQFRISPEEGPTLQGVRAFNCEYEREYISPKSWQPLKAAAQGGIFPVPAENYVWVLGTTNSENAAVPSEALMSHIFAPVASGGIGIYRGPFFNWAWESRQNLSAEIAYASEEGEVGEGSGYIHNAITRFGKFIPPTNCF